ncbi:Outer membrane porin F precursor [Roseovarius indicus]|uniref:Cell envelope biogenesis protein OmpA n=1 Tax=Roseovarius indicus TaxID=540747 RepID=A0A0T5PCY2_9RHOB|nr:OmpA family protein [Roseovarius indicus]KRS19147.1 cell envelope biogenesis protein OmpA [Roseovarius indicus]OAO06804.1 cell envelope biogenesis protein OmpA [Roseovarius indicus]QEW25895.1 Outer membrane porin F precursor [Roseovarius indicus]SFD89915.1 Outer membrane protein OmpA [Roseovarius indicus]
MTEYLSKTVRGILGGLAAAVIGISVTASYAEAQSGQRVVVGERYVPTIWVDPDGCEHWVMDDGWEGYMSPHVTRQGIPVCRRGNVCGVMNSDQLFATDSAHINASGRQRLASFFQQTQAISYIIVGHTDSRASDEYNLDLSLRRANSVAQIAASTGARIADVRGYGERMPKAPNSTAAGMQQNRRVEIICIR